MAKETIDVEKIVEWAYRVQCVDRQRAVSWLAISSASSGMSEFLRLGTRVDNSGAAARALGVRLPDDASIVHAAVLALPDAYIEWRARDEVEVWDAGLMAERGMVLMRNSKTPVLPAECEGPPMTDSTAFMIAPAYEPGEPSSPVPVEPVSSAVLVILNGRTGSRPEWHPDWRPSTRGAAGAADRRDVMHARAVYLAWRLALTRLQAALAGQLADFDVTGPEAPADPWKAKAPTVVADVRPVKQAVRRPARRRRA